MTLRAELKPLARYPVVAFVSCAFLFAAFLLLLLVALSLPILKTIYLVQLTSGATEASPLSVATELRFGVWGVCATSALDQPTWHSNPGLCFGPQLGYTVPDYFSAAIGISPEIIQVVEVGVIAILVLHPITAGLSTLSFLTSLFLASHAFSIFSLILTIITAVLSSLLLAIDIALVAIAQAKVKTLTTIHVDVAFGNAVWMVLVAVVFSWGGVITLSARACYCMGVRMHPDDKSRILDFRRRKEEPFMVTKDEEQSATI